VSPDRAARRAIPGHGIPGAAPVRLVATVLAAMIAWLPSARAQTAAGDPNLAHPTRVVIVERGGYSIAGLVTHREGSTVFGHGVALFAGSPGVLRIREEGGQPRFDLRGNFLVRSRRQWLDDDMLVVVVDAPSDEWRAFSQRFRETPRYGADVEALLAEVARQYAVGDWTFVGTSEGSISAFHAARMNPHRARRIILTASVFLYSANGPGLWNVKFDELAGSLLWVHHEHDPCRYTSYRDAREFSRRSGAPLLTVRGGGPGSGGPCEARSAHGFVGVERETVLAMRSWIRTGVVPEDVSP
jgi:hypothetical protein